jgi:hypothetical protein
VVLNQKLSQEPYAPRIFLLRATTVPGAILLLGAFSWELGRSWELSPRSYIGPGSIMGPRIIAAHKIRSLPPRIFSC